MDNELLNKIIEYKTNLEKEIKDVKDELTLLEEKEKNEKLTKKEIKRRKKLVSRQEELLHLYETVYDLLVCNSIETKLKKISIKGIKKTEKEKLTKELTQLFEKFNLLCEKSLINECAFTDKNIATLNDAKIKLQDQINELEQQKKDAENLGHSTTDIKATITAKKNLQIKINNYKGINAVELLIDLKKMPSNTKDYETIVKNHKDAVIEAINIDMEKFNKNELQDQEKSKAAIFLENHWKKIVAATLLIAAIYGLAQCNSKDSNHNLNNNTDDLDKTEDVSEITSDISQDESIDDVKPITNDFSSISGYDSAYAAMYDEIYTHYKGNSGNVIVSKEYVVSLVNRAAAVEKTNFFDDKDIYGIIPIIYTTDMNTIVRAENVNIKESVTTKFNNLYNNDILGINDNDEIHALKHIAEEGSYEDQFLTRLAEVYDKVDTAEWGTEERETASEEAYIFLEAFANSIGNGEDFVTKYTLYQTYVKPAMSAFITDKNQNKFTCLQITLQSAFEAWANLYDIEDPCLAQTSDTEGRVLVK